MPQQSQYMEQRLLERSRDRINHARVAIVVVAVILVASALTQIFVFRIVDGPSIAIMVTPASFFFILWLTSLRRPKVPLLIAFLLAGLFFLFNLFYLNLLAILLYGVVGVAIWQGFISAREMESKTQRETQSDLLDDDLLK